MQTNAHTLEARTSIYWDLSSMWNDRCDSVVSVGDAIEWCSNVSSMMRPELAIKRVTHRLLNEIVEGGSLGNKNKEPDNILPLAKPIKKARKQSER